MQPDPEIAMVEKAAADLGEYFETVQILVTRHSPKGDEDGTIHIEKGYGNCYARYAHARHWLISQEERTRMHEQLKTEAEESTEDSP